jgi:predicted DNA-binding transcriptional regulator YafY
MGRKKMTDVLATVPVGESLNPENHFMAIIYRNHRGETKFREIIPRRMFYGTTQWYEGRQWYLEAYDFEKKEMRTFAMAHIIRIGNPSTGPVIR